VTVVVLDGSAFTGSPQPAEAVADLRRRYPSLATVFVESPRLDPRALLHLGRVGVESLVLVQLAGRPPVSRPGSPSSAVPGGRPLETLAGRDVGRSAPMPC
jgi:hypothetical protein